MAVKMFYGLAGTLTASLAAGEGAMQVSANIANAMDAAAFEPGDEAYFLIQSAGLYEVVKATALAGNEVAISRAQGGTSDTAFPANATVAHIVTAEAITAGIPAGGTLIEPMSYDDYDNAIDISDEGGGSFVLGVRVPVFQGTNGIEVFGEYPDYRIAYVLPEDGCCGTGDAGDEDDDEDEEEAITEVYGYGLIQVDQFGSIVELYVQQPSFDTIGPIDITGSWPNYLITAYGSNGTVTNVGAGAGLVLTGSPTVNPTISMENTGVVAGDYGGLQVNPRGQITGIPLDFDPISAVDVVPDTGIAVNRVGSTVTITGEQAEVGVLGVVALADETEPFDPGDNTTAATPALVALALNDIAAPEASGVSTYAAEVAGDYSAPVAGSSVALLLDAGEQALVSAGATILNTATPLTAVDFGIAVFTSSGLLQGNRKMTQSQQSMQFLITGPFNDTIGLVTTAVPAGSTLVSHTLSCIKF